MINCEFDYCIYYQDGVCELEDISVSSVGVCASCKVPTIDSAILDKYKKEMLKRLEE